jgi:putative ABC transport system permease protein
MDPLKQDLQYGFRMLFKSPGFTIVAALTLAIGIGATCCIFSIINTVLLHPLPYNNPDRIVTVTNTFMQSGLKQIDLSVPEFIDLRDHSRLIEHIAITDPISVNLTGADQPERIQSMGISPSYFLLLGVNPLKGRAFIPEDEQPGITEIAVISYGLWQRRFGSDADIVGKKLRLDYDSYTIVGVMPRGFRHPNPQGNSDVEVWFPAGFRADPFPEPSRKDHRFSVLARLKPGVTLKQAQADIESIATGLRTAYPDLYSGDTGWSIVLTPLQEQIVGKMRPALLMLLGAVWLVLLISCSNIANLLLARATVRQKEVAIRTAMGATRARIIRQLLTESVLLALFSGVLGLLLALWSTNVVKRIGPVILPRADEIQIDKTVLGFALVVSLFTGLIFGLAPAYYSSKINLNEMLKEGGRAAGTGVRGNRVRSLLVVAEFAMALVLVISAGLLIKSFWRIQSVNPGFATRDVLTLGITLPYPNNPETGKYFESYQRSMFYRKLLQRVEVLPGIESAGMISRVPLSGLKGSQEFIIEGRENGEAVANAAAESQRISPSYFRTMSIPLLKGRDFTEQDDIKSPGVAIINMTMARQLWPNEDPLGHRIKLAGVPDARWLSIIGVASDVKTYGLDVDTPNEVYMSYLQRGPLTATLVVRTFSDPLSISNALQREVREVDADQPTYNVKMMDEIMSVAVGQKHFSMFLLGAFALIAIVLAAVGIYAVMSYTVTQRTHEMGIRMALGAQPRHIVRLVMTQGMKVVLIGIAAGLVISFVFTRAMSSLLFEISSTDMATFTTIPLLLIAIALTAMYLPSLRATKVDPMTALRHE